MRNNEKTKNIKKKTKNHQQSSMSFSGFFLKHKHSVYKTEEKLTLGGSICEGVCWNCIVYMTVFTFQKIVKFLRISIIFQIYYLFLTSCGNFF
jgi:hypothetical protein